MPMLLARIMGLRNEDHGAVARQVSLNASDPALIAANIPEKPSPPSKELFQSPKSRFTKRGEVEKSVRLYYNQFCAVFWIRWPLKVKLTQTLLVYFFPSLVHWNAFYISLMCSIDMDFHPCQYAKKTKTKTKTILCFKILLSSVLRTIHVQVEFSFMITFFCYYFRSWKTVVFQVQLAVGPLTLLKFYTWAMMLWWIFSIILALLKLEISSIPSAFISKAVRRPLICMC